MDKLYREIEIVGEPNIDDLSEETIDVISSMILDLYLKESSKSNK